MTKEITKAYILQQMQDKFGMREWEPAPFLFDETVVPTYDLSVHLETREIEMTINSVTDASNILFFTVPDDERWQFANYNLTFYSEGAYKVTGLNLIRHSHSDRYIYLDQTKEQAASYAVHLAVPVVLDPGDKIYVLVDTYVSTANLRLGIDVQKYKLR